MTEFSAPQQTIGILHQVRYALVILLQHEDSKIRLEALDDIDLSQPGSPAELFQLKHRAPNSKLTNTSIDLWKTLRIWSTRVKDGSIDPERELFSLVTTARAPEKSAAAHLRSAGRDTTGALEKLRAAMDTSESQELQPSFTAFKALDPEVQSRLVSHIYVFDNSPDIDGARSLLLDRLGLSVRREHREALVDRVEGWWFGRCIEHLRGRVPFLSGFEAFDVITDLARQFQPDALPIDFFRTQPGPEEKAALSKKMFVRQLESISVGTGRVEKAILDYYRAYAQRSQWARDRLLISDEIDRYEENLRDEWERMRLTLEDELEKPAVEEALQELGRKLLTWMETLADFRIRANVTEPYVMRGSYHMLADQTPPRV